MAIPTDNVIPLTGDPRIDGLTQGSAWRFGNDPRVITYSFSLNDTPVGGPWTDVLKDAARRAFDEWAHVANVNFVEVGSGTVFNLSQADIAIAATGNDLQLLSNGAAVSLGIFPSPAFADDFLIDSDYTRTSWKNPEGDIAIDNYYSGFNYLYAGGVGFTILLHEIGHSLGLKHPFDDGGNGRPTFSSLGIAESDNSVFTIMSYLESTGSGLGQHPESSNAATPMVLDILAIQQVYGVNGTYHGNNDNYVIAPEGELHSPIATIWDTSGVDTLSSPPNGLAGAYLDLREGQFSVVHDTVVAIAYNVVIENATGGLGTDTLIGNQANNRLDGGAGIDYMTGGPGDDTYLIDTAGDSVTELAFEGVDTIISSVAFSLPDNVENLTLVGTAPIGGYGNGLNNTLLGNSAANSLQGGAGNDYLDGAGGLDFMKGGPGDDTFIISDTRVIGANTLDLFGEPGARIFNGATTIHTVPLGIFLSDRNLDGKIDYMFIIDTDMGYQLTIGTNQLGQNLAVGNYVDAERAAFATLGHPGLDFGYRGIGSNSVFGSFTIDALEIDYSTSQPRLLSLVLSFELHSEFASAPATIGYFNYNNVNGIAIPETVVELSNEGNDKVRASVNYTLPANVENLTLTGTAAISGSGNELANVIVGNTASNYLSGGAGGDTFSGGGGADTFQYLAGGDSPQAAMDRILDFNTDDRLDFATASGLVVRPENYAWTTSLDVTLNTIRNDINIQNAIVSFIDNTKEYIYVKGAGSGVNFDGTLIELAGNTTPPAIANQHNIEAFAYSWKSHALLSGVALGTDTLPLTTNTNGVLHFDGYLGSVTETEATRAVPTVEAATTNAAVNLQDAIAILKMIVGLNVNGDNKPLSAYQAIAADFDHNGAVNLNDAIGVLKHVVGLDAPAPTWQFFHDTDVTMAARANLNPGIVPSLSVNLADSGGVGLVGVLLGDVDGGFVSPTNAPQLETLRPGYFASLAANHGINLSQFGIYPT